MACCMCSDAKSRVAKYLSTSLCSALRLSFTNVGIVLFDKFVCRIDFRKSKIRRPSERDRFGAPVVEDHLDFIDKHIQPRSAANSQNPSFILDFFRPTVCNRHTFSSPLTRLPVCLKYRTKTELRTRWSGQLLCTACRPSQKPRPQMDILFSLGCNRSA